jgi:hypothetical protein
MPLPDGGLGLPPLPPSPNCSGAWRCDRDRASADIAPAPLLPPLLLPLLPPLLLPLGICPCEAGRASLAKSSLRTLARSREEGRPPMPELRICDFCIDCDCCRASAFSSAFISSFQFAISPAGDDRTRASFGFKIWLEGWRFMWRISLTLPVRTKNWGRWRKGSGQWSELLLGAVAVRGCCSTPPSRTV